MLLEDAQIDLAYSCDAIAREWSVHGIADQGVCLFAGTPFASPSTVFQIDAHPDHAQAESGARFERRADDAFSRSISHNLRISGEIRQFGTISSGHHPVQFLPVLETLAPIFTVILQHFYR